MAHGCSLRVVTQKSGLNKSECIDLPLRKNGDSSQISNSTESESRAKEKLKNYLFEFRKNENSENSN